MLFQFTFVAVCLTLITGCSSIGSANQTNIAGRVVNQADPSKIEHVAIVVLHESTQHESEPSRFAGKVVQITGKVITFALTENNLYTVTLSEDDSNATCIFDDSISGQFGDDRLIRPNATLTIVGQYEASGLFSSSPFTLNGCRIVN